MKVALYSIKNGITKPTFSEYAPHKLAFYENMVPTMNRILDIHDKPVFFNPRQAAWCIGGDYDVIKSLYTDKRLSIRFPDWRFAENKPESEMTPLEKLNSNLLMSMAPEDHSRVRKAAGPAFSPRTVKNLHNDIQAIIDEELDKLESQFDLTTVTEAIPMRVITAYIGVSDKHYTDLDELSKSITSSYDPTIVYDKKKALHGLEVIQQAIREKEQLVHTLIAEHADSGDTASIEDYIADRSKDFLTSLMLKSVQAGKGENGESIYVTHKEALSLVGSSLAAGPDTTKQHLNWVLIALMRNSEAITRILADETSETLDHAIIEGYRSEHLAHSGSVRFALEDFEIYGQKIEKGEMIRIMNCAAVYSPAKFPDPLTFNLDRDNLGDLVVYGLGRHFCLGHAIAKKITSMTVLSILRKFPDLKMDEKPIFRKHFITRDIQRLMVSSVD